MKTSSQRNKEKDHIARLNKQHRKEFFANLHVVCNLLAGYDLYSKIPAAVLEKIYKHRFHRTSVHADDAVISRKDLLELSEDLKAMFLVNYLDLPNGKGQVALSLQLIEGHSLTFLAKHLKDDEFPAARELREALSYYVEPEYDRYFYVKVQETLFLFSLMVSSFDHGIIYAHMKTEITNTKLSLQYSFHIDKIFPVKETFIIDGHVRPAFRVGWAFPYTGLVWAEIKPGERGLTKDKPLPVFIQAHALLRLQERTDLPSGLTHHSVHYSIQNLTYIVDQNGKVLIDYIYHQKKIGYLVGSVENNGLLLHTFLFLTNNGTPEGKKLSELTGLQLLDKKYLAIDKLSTFLAYKINDNAFVKNIFVQAGCGHLLEIEDVNQFLFHPEKEISAETIANYLKAIPSNP